MLFSMRTRLGVAGVVAVAVLAALVALGPAAQSASAVELTFIGDSKAAAIEFSGKAKRLLSRGHDVRRDLKVCRRLVAPSCEYLGVTPRTALEVVRHHGTDLGTVLVIDVGYNDSSSTYRSQLNQVMRAALSREVDGVVWVNLRAVRADYGRINSIINRARSRWPQLYVANWNRHSDGHPGWFSPTIADGIHLTKAGAVGLVKLVRRYIPLAAEGPRETVAAVSTSEAPTPTEAPATTEEESAATDLSANSPAVGSNLGGGGSTGLGDVLPFVAGAALMLFLIFVTVKRRGAAPSS
jgi:hypothetical protein